MLGIPYQDIIGKYPFDSVCSFTRYFSYSIGDWANISGVFEVLKKDNPNTIFEIPSAKLLKEIAPNYQNWGTDKYDASEYINLIYQNNPNVTIVDKFTSKPITDHFRAQVNIEIPLAEKILLRFGYIPDELGKRDCTPKLYLSKEEIDNVKNTSYGCLLFGSRLKDLKGRWDFDHYLFKFAEQYKDSLVYYYSEFDLKDTEWDELFPIRYDLSRLNLREQLVIKSRAKFNIGYQAGMNDAVSRHSNNIILTPYDNVKENIIRNVKYIHLDGKIKQI